MKVQAILTNSGSNMVAAFKQICSEGDEDEDVDSIASPSVNASSDYEDATEIQKDIEEFERKELELVSRVNKSAKVTEMLIAQAGKKLIGCCHRRWSSNLPDGSCVVVQLTCLLHHSQQLVRDGLQASE